jgi:hypothetical protein
MKKRDIFFPVAVSSPDTPRRVQQHLVRQAGERNRGKRTDDPVAAGKRYPEPFHGGLRKQ